MKASLLTDLEPSEKLLRSLPVIMKCELFGDFSPVYVTTKPSRKLISATFKL